jgi:hypothetical protein
VADRDGQVLQRPALEAKVRDVVGLYVNPPDKAVVLCVDAPRTHLNTKLWPANGTQPPVTTIRGEPPSPAAHPAHES